MQALGEVKVPIAKCLNVRAEERFALSPNLRSVLINDAKKGALGRLRRAPPLLITPFSIFDLGRRVRRRLGRHAGQRRGQSLRLIVPSPNASPGRLKQSHQVEDCRSGPHECLAFSRLVYSKRPSVWNFVAKPGRRRQALDPRTLRNANR